MRHVTSNHVTRHPFTPGRLHVNENIPLRRRRRLPQRRLVSDVHFELWIIVLLLHAWVAGMSAMHNAWFIIITAVM